MSKSLSEKDVVVATSPASIDALSSKLAAQYAINSKAQENYAHGDYAECIKNLIVYFTSSLTSLVSSSDELNVCAQKLTSLVDDTNILKLKSAVNMIFARIGPNLANNAASNSSSSSSQPPTAANILMLNNNDFFLSLLATTQSILSTTLSVQCRDNVVSDAGLVINKYANILTTVYLNNLALTHYSLSKFNLSMLYFQKSFIQSNSKYMLGDGNSETTG